MDLEGIEIMLKGMLQNFVVKTNFWPFPRLYKIYYDAVLKIIIYILKRQKEVLAIYLTSGMATGDYICGLSDIDLILVIEADKENKKKIDKIYKKLSCLIPLLKYDERGIYTIEEIRYSYYHGYHKPHIYLKYKLFNINKCKKTGRLLYGRDVLSNFPELDDKRKKESALGYLAFIWSIFMRSFLIEKGLKDMVSQNYLCYKLSADICQAFTLVKDNKEIFNRQRALELCKGYLDKNYIIHIERMQELSKNSFCLNNFSILPDTYNFCLYLLNKTVGYINSLYDDEYDKEGKINGQIYFDSEPPDFMLSDVNKEKINNIVGLIRRKYKEYIQSILLSPFDPADEKDICLFIIQRRETPLEIIKELNSIIGLNQCHQRLYLHIATPDMVVSLNRSELGQLHTALFSPYIKPLNFLFLNTPLSAIYGESLNCNKSKGFLVKFFLHTFPEFIEEYRKEIMKLINNPDIVRISNVDFHLLFWRSLQLKLIKNSAILGKIPVPLSSGQVCQYWNTSQSYKLNWLKEFHDEYKKDLNGIPSNSEVYFSEAIAALKKIYNFYPSESIVKYEYSKE